MKEIDNTRTIDAEVRGQWGEMMATKQVGLLQSDPANTFDSDSVQDAINSHPTFPVSSVLPLVQFNPLIA